MQASSNIAISFSLKFFFFSAIPPQKLVEFSNQRFV